LRSLGISTIIVPSAAKSAILSKSWVSPVSHWQSSLGKLSCGPRIITYVVSVFVAGANGEMKTLEPNGGPYRVQLSDLFIVTLLFAIPMACVRWLPWEFLPGDEWYGIASMSLLAAFTSFGWLRGRTLGVLLGATCAVPVAGILALAAVFT
jgi:hypothetical protein